MFGFLVLARLLIGYYDKFAVGNGFLNFYLYNWRTAPLAGMNSENGVPVGRGIGVVMV